MSEDLKEVREGDLQVKSIASRENQVQRPWGMCLVCMYEKQPRGQLAGTKGGRKRLIREKVQEVTLARLRGPRRLFW